MMARNWEEIDMFEMWEENRPDLKLEDFTSLRDNALKAANPPPRRSNELPKELENTFSNFMVKKYEEIQENGRSLSFMPSGDYYLPEDWFIAIMTRVYTLWKLGIIQPTYNIYNLVIQPMTICGREMENGSLHFYVAYRSEYRVGV